MTLNLEQRLSLGSDDEADLVQELQSMCSSKSESDISKVSGTKGEVVDGQPQPRRDFFGPHHDTPSLGENFLIEEGG